ncbi:hypothetical protein [Mesorhizobium sp. 2RAF21]|uniref:hypothetical protein n=1 Tax=Mesorhizobium sp. 2RAF21 TaxID=3232995 RepID=UPI003F9DC79A
MMLDKARNPAICRRTNKLARQVAVWEFDEAFGDLDIPKFAEDFRPAVRFSTRQEIRDHYVDVVSVLKRYARWDSHRIADYIGVSRQTSYQYGFQPTARGARVIPGDKLDKLRDAATAAIYEDLKTTFAPGVTAEMRTWQVFVGMNLELETFSRLYGESQAARLGGVCVPHDCNAKPNAQLSDEDELCVEWLRWRHAGHIAKSEAVHVAGVDQYLEGRVGCEGIPWRIVPTAYQVAALRDIHHRREGRNA